MRLTSFVPIFAATLFTAHAQCIFNSTHCACALSSADPGLCTRYSSGIPSSATCYVDNCRSTRYICDCNGSELCELETCNAWKADNPNDVITLGDFVPCAFQMGSATCVIGPSPSPSPSASATPPPSPAASPSPTPTTSPSASASSTPAPTPSSSPSSSPSVSATPSASPNYPEYRMVQFGAASEPTMFNMTFFTDTSDFITTTYDMQDAWPQQTRYEHRWHTIMMYANNAGDEYFLCYVINAYNQGDDGLGNMETDITIAGVDGQIMRWVACDDVFDSCQTPSGIILTSFFENTAWTTDGFCIKPVDFSSNTFTIRATNVNGARGIRFIGPTQTIAEYSWADGPGNGMTGVVDGNGLVTAGSSPIMTFNLNGILMP